MSIRTILVNVDLIDTATSPALRYAIGLAEMFDAELIGLAAEEPNLAYAGVDSTSAAVDLYAMEHEEIEKRLRDAGQQFAGMVPPGTASQWRPFMSSVSRCLVDNASSADLIVTSSCSKTAFQGALRVNLGELVVKAGRPVLDVGETTVRAKFDKILIGWKDTREARRAVCDALPFLQRAGTVSAITMSEGEAAAERRSLDALSSWLGRHGISVETELVENRDNYEDVLESVALSRNVDLVVAGGYGHSQVREWLFGGMTRTLLETNTLNRLLSN